MNRILNAKGFSLVTILAVGAVVAIIAGTITKTITDLQKQSKAVSEILSIQEYERRVSASLFDKDLCPYIFSSYTFDSNRIVVGKQSTLFELGNSPIYASMVNSTTPGPVLIKKGDPISSYIKTIKLLNTKFEIFGGTVAGTTGKFNARWIFEFDSTQAQRKVKPLFIYSIVTADVSTPEAAKIKDCFIDVKHSIFKQSCPPGQVIKGYDGNGIIQCVLNHFTCPVGQLFSKVDSSGNPVCIDQIQVGGCLSGQVISGIFKDKQPQCRNMELHK